MASGKQPITRHPLFPATVALWFGALFGIGSLAVRPALIESAIIALKLDAIIAVPMSPTTRILIALALAGVGGLLGASLARRFGRPKPVARPRKRGARFTAHDAESPATSSDPEATTSPAVRTSRRTQLAIPDNAHGEVDYYDRAPVPGATPILDVSQFDINGFGPQKEPAKNLDSEPALSTHVEINNEAVFLPGPGYDRAPASPEARDKVVEHIAVSPAANPALPRLAGDEAGPAIAKGASITQPLFNPSPASGLFAQPFNAKVSEIRWEDEIAPVEGQPEPEADLNPDAAPKSDGRAAERIVSARLDDLAPIELLERLAISLREKRSRAELAADEHSIEPTPIVQDSSDHDRPVAETSLNESTNQNFEDETKKLEAEELVSTPAAPITPPAPAIPAALRPIGLEPEDDDEDALPGYIPPRQIGGAMQT